MQYRRLGASGLMVPALSFGTATFGGTSSASPIVTGAAANLKDHLISTLPSPWGNEVGLLFAHMMLMGDGEIESSRREGVHVVQINSSASDCVRWHLRGV